MAVALPGPQEMDLFADSHSVRIDAEVQPRQLPANGSLHVRYQLQNASKTAVLASDEDGGGATLRVVIRDVKGVEIPESSAQDVAISGFTRVQRLAQLWFVIPRGHFAGGTIEANLGGYPAIVGGSRYSVSVRLISQPDNKLTRKELEAVAPIGTRILKGEFESEPVWITTKKACCDAGNKNP